MSLELGDVVEVKTTVWRSTRLKGEPPYGRIIYVSPVGDRRVLIDGCGRQFKQDEVNLLSVDVDVSEFL